MPRSHGLSSKPAFDHLLLGLLVAGTAWLALTYARSPGELEAIWVGTGVLAGWLLSRPTASWPGYVAVAFAAELPARLLAGDTMGYALPVAGINLLEALAVAGVVRHRVPDVRDPDQWIRLGGIATAATLVACAASGLLAAAVSHSMLGHALLPTLAHWYAAHVLGMVMLGTMTLVVQGEGRGLFVARTRRWDLAATLGVVVATTAAVFAAGYPLLFLSYPALLLAALRHHFAGAAMAVIAMGLVAGIATFLGHGPLWRDGIDGTARIALVQLYLAGGCILTLPVCLFMADRKRMARRLADSERRYRLLADHSHDVISRVTADGWPLYVSPSATDMLGLTPGELPHSRLDLVHPDDIEAQRHAIAEVLATGESRTEVYRLRHREGHYVWVEAVLRRVPPEAGHGPPEVMFTARNISRRVAAEQALAESLRELERLAREDALTGVANRRQFEERAEMALRRLKRHGTAVALLCMDLDHFKQVNDSLGHAGGDLALQVFAQRLYGCVRETDLVARLGGDEFAILLEDALPGSGEAVAAKLLEAMREPMQVAGRSLVIGTSIGIAYATGPTDAATLLQWADAALYAAKNGGRGRYEVAGVTTGTGVPTGDGIPAGDEDATA